MANIILKHGIQNPGAGLGTWEYDVASPANPVGSVLPINYTIKVQSSVSSLTSTMPNSGLLVVINKNGSPIFSSTAMGADQSKLQIEALAGAVPGDIFTIVLTSSKSNDNDAKYIKTLFTVTQANGV